MIPRRLVGYRPAVGMQNYLIEGVSGTGKTSVCQELRRRGFHAINGDTDLAYHGEPERASRWTTCRRTGITSGTWTESEPWSPTRLSASPSSAAARGTSRSSGPVDGVFPGASVRVEAGRNHRLECGKVRRFRSLVYESHLS